MVSHTKTKLVFARPKTLRRVLALLSLCVGSWLGLQDTVAQPQPDAGDWAQRIERDGTVALDAGEYQRAERLFRSGLRSSEAANNAKATAKFAFKLGLTAQEYLSTLPTQSEKRRIASDNARIHYLKVLEIRPDSAAAANNLAEVYREQGRNEQAEHFYKRAIKSDDPRQALYLRNYANWLGETGKYEQAVPVYKRLVKLQPQSSEAHRALMSHYLKNPERLAEYVWELEIAGQVRRAQLASLEGLEASPASTSARTELLAAFVAALGSEYFDPKTFTASRRAVRLQAFRDDLAIGQGVQELFTLLSAQSWDPNLYDWWRERGSSYQDPERGMWPRDAFRRLIRSMGGWFKRAGEREVAKLFLEMSAVLEHDDPDPKAFRDLTDIYIEAGDLNAVKNLMDRFEVEMFTGKGEAYRRSQQGKILEYHSILGKVYAHIGEWGNSSTPASAIFQLEHARTVAGRLERQDDAPPNFNADLAVLLARSYEAVDRNNEAIAVRLDTANRYHAIGNTKDAARLLRPLRDQPVPPTLDNKYRELQPYLLKQRVTPEINRIERVQPSN